MMISRVVKANIFLTFCLLNLALYSCASEGNDAMKVGPNSKSMISKNERKVHLWDDTVKKVFKHGDHKLHYTILQYVDSVPKEKIPLVVFLHGSGERGNDNIAQLKVGLPNLIQSFKKEGMNQFMVLAPQCPENQLWSDADWTQPAHVMKKNMLWTLESIFSIIDSITQNNPWVDTNRIYVTGLSMGGFGTWEMIQRRPDFFAAAIPICGGGDKTQVKDLVQLPIWAFHGRKDKAVMVGRTTDMYSAIQKEVGSGKLKIKMTIYESKGHLIWNDTYDNAEVVQWLLSQSKEKH
jgi:predicted peptidase